MKWVDRFESHRSRKKSIKIIGNVILARQIEEHNYQLRTSTLDCEVHVMKCLNSLSLVIFMLTETPSGALGKLILNIRFIAFLEFQ